MQYRESLYHCILKMLGHVKKKNTSMEGKTMMIKFAEQTTVKQQENTVSPKANI
jgi:hypothetical protein